MNPQLIEKAIKSGNASCPELTFNDPLLDPAVANALSKSFTQILTSKGDSNVNSNLRQAVLENLRKICTLIPEGHLQLRERQTALLVDVYKNVIYSHMNATEQMLRAFLVRTYIETDIKCCYCLKVDPELVQALVNLNPSIFKDMPDSVLLWNTSDPRFSAILNSLWDQNILRSEVVIKLKPEIEIVMLNLCAKVLENRDLDIKQELQNSNYERIMSTCAEVPHCFQICSLILNTVLKATKFDSAILDLVYTFKTYIKGRCKGSFPSLYPTSYAHVAGQLDFDIEVLQEPALRGEYVQRAITWMTNVKKDSPDYFTLLLSHFPEWFDIIT